MEFCDECGSMMVREEGTWVCTSCGHEQGGASDEAYVITEAREETELIEVDAAADRGLPTTEARCRECDNDRAYWYLQQLRSADESETRFFICTECGHRWREDDH
ncbi:MAG: transcription factor S [Halobacteriota archaeon]